MKIQLKRSNVLSSGAAKVPTASQLEYGELAVNYNTSDPAIFLKDSNNNIIRISGVGNISDDGLTNVPDGTTPPANPEAGNLWYNSDQGRLYIYFTDADSSQWVDASPDSWDPSSYPDVTNSSAQSGTLDDRYAMVNGGNSFTGDLTIPDKIIHSADTNTAIRFPANDTVSVETAGNERLRIDSSGNVGIGAASTSAKLHISTTDSTNSPDLLFLENLGTGNNTGSTIYFRNRTGTAFTDCTIQSLGSSTNNSELLFSTEQGSGPTERLRINSSGKVGIGVSSPDFNCHIVGTGTDLLKIQRSGAGGGARFRMINGDSNYYDIFHDGAENLTFGYNGSERMRVTSSGNVGIGVSSPSAKLEVNGAATFGGPLTVSNLASGFSTFFHSSGNGGIKITGAAGGSNANLVFSNNYTGTIDDIWTIQMQGADDSLAFRAGGPGDSDVITFTSTGAATFAGRITNGPAWNTSASLNQAIIDNGTVYTHRQQGTDAVFSAFQGTQGTQNVNIFASGNAEFAGTITSGHSTTGAAYNFDARSTNYVLRGFNFNLTAGAANNPSVSNFDRCTSVITADGSAQFDLNVRTGGIQTTIPASPGSNNLYNFFQSKRATTEINTAFADSGGAQVVRLYNNGSAIFAGNVTTSGAVEIGNFSSTTAAAVYIGSGAVQAYRDSGVNAATSATFVGGRKTGSGSDATAFIYSDGSATFDGAVSAQGSVLTSDQRFKENITDANSQLADVTALGNILRNWDWTADAPVADKGTRFLGLVAQEAETICPGIVKTIARTKQGAELTPETTDEKGNVTPATYEELDDSYKGISNDALIMKLLGAVAELSAKVAALEAG